MPEFRDTTSALEYLAEAFNRHSERILRLEGEGIIHRQAIRQLMGLAAINDDGFATAWDAALETTKTEWMSHLSEADEPTRKQIKAGIAEIDRLKIEIAPQDERPRFEVFDGGKT